MATTNILELRQPDASSINANGDYETVLINDIILEDGDAIILKNAFIDSKTEGNIVLNSDTTLTLQWIPYITDWYKTTDKINYVKSDNSVTTIDTTNGLDFIPYYFTAGGIIPGYQQVTGVNYFYNTQDPDNPKTISTTYSYVNLNNQTIIFHTTIRQSDLPNEFGNYTDPLLNIIAANGSFKQLTPQSTLDLLFLKNRGITISPDPVEANTWNPYIFETSILVPAGNYSPDYLTLLISEKLSKNNSNNLPSFNGLCQSPFLKSSSAYDVGKPYPNGAQGTIGTEGTAYVSTDYSLRFQMEEGKFYYIGTSQVALEYDTTSNKVVWQFLHFPMYDSATGTNISVRYQFYDGNSDEKSIATSKNGGILFTGLTATDTNNNTIDFWESILGFNVAQLCVNQHAGYISNTLGLTGQIQTISTPVVGVNMTQGFFGLDTVVIKKESEFFLEPQLSGSGAVITSTINNTESIEASFSIDELINKYSHYLIETDICFANSFTGTQYYKNINGVISKYYSDASYTFGDSAGAIEYIHKGAPSMISSVKVRILTSAKVLDPDLGPDNTIVFQIIKAQPVVKTV
jgi:hypothetical protein